jgi:flagellar hook-basal body complex protein FliE
VKIGQALTLNQEIGKRTLIDRTLQDTNSSFGETLSRAISDVNALQSEAGRQAEKLVSGEAVDLHEVMIAAEKARTSFDLLMEIRNKTVEAYREIMRMQV